MKEQRYILEHNSQVAINGKLYIPPRLDAKNVKDKDLFLKKCFYLKRRC